MISSTTRSGGIDKKAIAIAEFVLTAVGLEVMSQNSRSSTAGQGFRSEFLNDLDRLEQKLVGLAEAIPATEYGWRPAENVRTVSQALIHVAVGNYRILSSLGSPVPENIEEMEEYVDKEMVLATLESSIESVRSTVVPFTEEALEEQVDFYGRTLTKRAILYLVGTHMHEHLGQIIAYARSIGVTPPWSTSVDPEDG